MAQHSKDGRWQRLTSKVVYDNRWIRVHHDEVLTPGGTEGVYGVVHFKQHAVGVVPIDEEGHTWLVRQTRYTLGAASWEIPEGGSPEGEETLATAKRELEEECGLRARRWEPLLQLHLSNSITDEAGTVYIARDILAGEQKLDATEDIEVRRLPLAEAVQMVRNGEITDAMSVAALLRAAMEH